MIDVLVIGPTRIHVERVSLDNPDDFNRLVGGSISACPLPPALQRAGFYAYCDDDAIRRGQKLNRWRTHLGHHVLRGPIVIFKTDGMGGEVGLEPQEVRRLAQYLANPPTSEAQRLAERDRRFWVDNPSGMRIESIDNLEDFLGTEQ
jgi:hypothetical protein